MRRGLYKRVSIEWEDAAHWRGWRDAKEAKDAPTGRCFSTGFLVNNTRSKVVIAQSYSTMANDEQTLEVGDLLVIPKKWVKKIKNA